MGFNRRNRHTPHNAAAPAPQNRAASRSRAPDVGPTRQGRCRRNPTAPRMGDVKASDRAVSLCHHDVVVLIRLKNASPNVARTAIKKPTTRRLILSCVGTRGPTARLCALTPYTGWGGRFHLVRQRRGPRFTLPCARLCGYVGKCAGSHQSSSGVLGVRRRPIRGAKLSDCRSNPRGIGSPPDIAEGPRRSGQDQHLHA
jgi:hypothetical protein